VLEIAIDEAPTIRGNREHTDHPSKVDPQADQANLNRVLDHGNDQGRRAGF
jgi:hypothetical protein